MDFEQFLKEHAELKLSKEDLEKAVRKGDVFQLLAQAFHVCTARIDAKCECEGPFEEVLTVIKALQRDSLKCERHEAQLKNGKWN
jgi:hypothetical protein